MPVYEYKGLNAEGREIKGVRDADSARSLKTALKKEGILITSFAEQAAAAAARRGIDLSKYFSRVSIQDLSVFTRQMSTLLKAGIPLVDSLNALADQVENPKLRLIVSQVKQFVNEGGSLGDALAQHPKVFNSLFVNMVKAGESSGALDLVLVRLADFMENQARLRTKVLSALFYPILMVFVGSLIVGMVFVFIIPKITKIFEDVKASLPLPTLILIGISNFVKSYWWLIIIVVGTGIWYFRRWKASPKGKAKWDAFVLRSFIFGNIIRMLAVSRFSRTLGTLLQSGVPILTALDIVKNILNNTVLVAAVEDARESIKEGESIAGPLKRSGQFPPMVIHMIQTGEKSGHLEEMLGNVADAYDYQVETRLAVLVAMLEPIMILGMAGAVLIIVLSILLPILKINEFVQ
jgi:general secretion pathway protein F